MSLTIKDYIGTVITVLFVLLFTYTGINKLIDYTIFKEQIATSPILASITKYFALGIPWIEFIVALILIVPASRLVGLYASFALMVIFTVYVVSIILFYNKLPCSCGGIMQELSWKGHVIVNIVLTGLAIVGIIFERQLIKSKKIPLQILHPSHK